MDSTQSGDGMNLLPSQRFNELLGQVKRERVTKFSMIEEALLDWLWCVDGYRINGSVPSDFGTRRSAASEEARNGAFYRTRGDRLADVLLALLRNRCGVNLAPRSRVKGFSQEHQIDIAWSPEDGPILADPVVCCEVKILGAPSDGTKPDRSIRSDWTNRRKELKFQAADLKLFQGREDPNIRNWDQWRASVPPRVYTIWAGRIFSRTDAEYMTDQARDLTDTYLDGVGVFPFAPNETNTAYRALNDGRSVRGRLTHVDTILDRMQADIERYATTP
ncbi:hypothetical protein QUG92_08695 [Curtobacterium sp. RHCKG23]|uniref:Restriction endonuclease n=1 Tax=Curtobacterium citri TaxID=3055139 RepID=A0ABT7T6I9_9MICO|nr:hypothetical protein [Curtobacterium citri]MDM7885183.1 hypothetical protein [Curtobacterium citri]